MNGLFQLLGTHIPALLVMVLGYALLVFEMYVPGFGVPGFSGIALLIVGMILAQPTPLQAVMLILIWLVLLGIALAIAMHSLAKGRLNRTDLVLHDAIDPRSGEAPSESLIGRTGTAHTALRPAGILLLENGQRVNVVSDGDFIAAGEKLRIERVEGGRIVVTRPDP